MLCEKVVFKALVVETDPQFCELGLQSDLMCKSTYT